MSRLKIEIPKSSALFQTCIPIRITDMNYGNHLANDKILAIAHEARVQWLASLGYSELNVGGCGLIMADAQISYKQECLYGDQVQVSLYLDNLQLHTFDLYYNLYTQRNQNVITIATIKIGMVAFDYELRKVNRFSEHFITHLKNSMN